MSFATFPIYETKITEKRTLGEDAAPSPRHSRANVPEDVRTINGWGADLDPANRPAVPREFPSNVRDVRGEVKHWQTPRSKIHVSNEHPGITPVFGDTIPPKGLSGLLRDYAYQFGEGTNRHWMTLVLADRVDRVECMVGDLFRGRGDNIIREKGWSALRFEGEGFKNVNPVVVVGVAVVGAIGIGMLVRRLMR
jgi:hypothetical protein